MSRFRVVLAAGVAVAIASGFAPMSSDEGAWLAIERRVAAGGTLYVDAIDNKSPFVFWLVRGLDLLPGGYEPWRGVLLGAFVIVAGILAARVLERLGCEQWTATAGGVLAGVSLPLASVLTLTIELPAAALAFAAFALGTSGRPIAGGAVLACGVLFDPRAIALLPALVWLVLRLGAPRAAVAAGLSGAAIAGAWAAIVLATPDLRFALVDLNLASRAAAVTDPVEQLAAALRATVVPVVGVLVLSRAGRATDDRPPVKEVLLAAVPVVVIIAASRHGFDHYWTLLMPVAPLVLAALLRPVTPRMPRIVAASFVVLAAVAPLAHAARLHMEQSETIDRYEAVAAELDAHLGAKEMFVQFTGDPYLAAFLPRRFDGASPLLGYLVSDHPRRADYIARMQDQVRGAAAIVEDGGLGAGREQVLPGYRDLFDLFVASLDGFPCDRRIRGIVVHYRVCPSGMGP